MEDPFFKGEDTAILLFRYLGFFLGGDSQWCGSGMGMG